MLIVAFLMALVSSLVCLYSAKIGAGVGRDLRGKIYSKVMRFSDAEMGKYSTASLITRSTNDVQQIQMVETMLLRMIIYAPIIGIGGIIKVIQTGSGMGFRRVSYCRDRSRKSRLESARSASSEKAESTALICCGLS